MSKLCDVVAACNWCNRGYVRIHHEGIRCRYPTCTGRVYSIEPTPNNFNFGMRWEPMPKYLIRWVASQ